MNLLMKRTYDILTKFHINLYIYIYIIFLINRFYLIKDLIGFQTYIIFNNSEN